MRGKTIDLLDPVDLKPVALLGEWKLQHGVPLTPVLSGPRLKLRVGASSACGLLMKLAPLKGHDTLSIGIVVREDNIRPTAALDGWLGRACGLHH